VEVEFGSCAQEERKEMAKENKQDKKRRKKRLDMYVSKTRPFGTTGR
jgi:hypothetical protein